MPPSRIALGLLLAAPVPGLAADSTSYSLLDHCRRAELVVAAEVEHAGSHVVTLRVAAVLAGQAPGEHVEVSYPNLWLQHGVPTAQPAYAPGDVVLAFLRAGSDGLLVPVNPQHGTATRVLDDAERLAYRRRVRQLLNVGKLAPDVRDRRTVEILVEMVEDTRTRRDGLWMLDTKPAKRAAFGWSVDYAALLAPEQLVRLRALASLTHQAWERALAGQQAETGGAGAGADAGAGAEGAGTSAPARSPVAVAPGAVDTARLMAVIAHRLGVPEALSIADELLEANRLGPAGLEVDAELLGRFLEVVGPVIDGAADAAPERTLPASGPLGGSLGAAAGGAAAR